MESDEERNRRSFGLSVADEKIKLIDILSETDDFLVASSPFCTDSLTDGAIREAGGFGHSQEVEKIQQCDEFVQSSRPSFLRRSLAWDTAFFDSDGVLDPDELSFINKGYRTTIDVRKRRSESGPTPPTGGGLSLDWFEIEPSIYDCTPAALKKVDKSSRNEVMSDQTSTKKSIFVQSEEKIKKTASSRRRPGRVPSPKPPNVFGRKAMDLSTTSQKELSGKSSIKVDTKSATAVADEKTSSNHNSTSLPSPKFSSVVLPASPIVSTASVPLLGTSRLSSSVSASKIWRHTERRKGIGHLSLSTRSSSLSDSLSCLPPGSSTSPWASGSRSSPVCNKQRSNEAKVRKIFPGPFQNDGKEASNLRISLNSPLGSHKDYSSQVMISRPSGLRPPSPQIRFFDENTPPKYEGTTRSRKIPRKVVPGESLQESRIGSRHSSACVKLTSPHSGTMGKNIKRSKIEYTNSFMKIGSADDGGKHPVNKHGQNSCREENKRRDKLKNKARGGSGRPEREVKKSSDQENGKKNMSRSCIDQLGNLSEYFDAIDLNQEKGQELKKKQAGFRSARNKNDVQNDGMPAYKLIKKENLMVLESPQSVKDADKTSASNLSEEFGFSTEPKKERAGFCASSGSATRDKENNEKAKLPR